MLSFTHFISVFPSFHCVHALHTVYAPLAHGLAVANMLAAELSIGPQKHFNTQK